MLRAVALLSGMLVLATLTRIPAAHASLLRYSFTVREASGPLAGESQSGTFGFDNSLAIPFDTNLDPGQLSELAFTFAGASYDAATANTGALQFDGAGALQLVDFGSDCGGRGTCGIDTTKIDWLMTGTSTASVFVYTLGTGGVWYDGTGSFAPLSEIPEPPSLALFATGLLPLASRRRRGAARAKRA
jgi:hypothetical protein